MDRLATYSERDLVRVFFKRITACLFDSSENGAQAENEVFAALVTPAYHSSRPCRCAKVPLKIGHLARGDLDREIINPWSPSQAGTPGDRGSSREVNVNVRKHAKQRAELTWRGWKSLHMIDDDTQGLWAKKRAYQEQSRELVRSGERTQESLFFVPPEFARKMTITHRSDRF
jgi:hypothetical protein